MRSEGYRYKESDLSLTLSNSDLGTKCRGSTQVPRKTAKENSMARGNCESFRSREAKSQS